MENNNKINIKSIILKILKIIGITFLSLILLFVLIIFGIAIHNYRQLLPYDKGYHQEDTVGIFDYNGKTYSIDSDFGDINKLGRYYECKSKTDNSLHIVADNNILIAIFQDYKVSAIEDDPNGYVYKGEADLFGPFTYYSDDIQEPSPEKNEIRQIIINYGWVDREISITDKTVINELINIIKKGENPEQFLIDSEVGLSVELIEICIDYADFPLYQRIYNKNYSDFVCPIIEPESDSQIDN